MTRRFPSIIAVLTLTVFACIAADASARAPRGHRFTEGAGRFSIIAPHGWKAEAWKSGGTGPFDPSGGLALLTPPGARLGQGTILPKGAARITLTVEHHQDIDEYAELVRLAQFLTDAVISRNPTRMSGVDHDGQRVVVEELRKDGKLFYAHLSYNVNVGDPRADQYEHTFTEVLESLTLSDTFRAVPTPAPEVFVTIGSARGAPGDIVTFSVTMDSTRKDVGWVQTDIAFESAVPVGVNSEGRPHCSRSDEISNFHGKVSVSFGWAGVAPPSSMVREGTEPHLLRAAVEPMEQAIPSGTKLYSCTVEIPRSAIPDHYPLVLLDGRSHSRSWEDLRVAGTSGEVIVETAPLEGE